jgi:hypothetical protein
MLFKRLMSAGLLVAVCSVVASSGDAEARGCRCRNNGWRSGYSYRSNYNGGYGYTYGTQQGPISGTVAAPVNTNGQPNTYQTNYAGTATVQADQLPNPAPIDPLPQGTAPEQAGDQNPVAGGKNAPAGQLAPAPAQY